MGESHGQGQGRGHDGVQSHGQLNGSGAKARAKARDERAEGRAILSTKPGRNCVSVGFLEVGRVASFWREARAQRAELTNVQRAGQTDTRQGSANSLD